MGNLSKHFNREEFKCKCKRRDCDQTTVDHDLVIVLEKLHEDVAYMFKARVRVIINSGNRCKYHNMVSGGEPDSFHIESKAADITVQIFLGGKWRSVETETIHDYFCEKYPGKYGLIRYDMFNHVDIRENEYRSEKTTNIGG